MDIHFRLSTIHGYLLEAMYPPTLSSADRPRRASIPSRAIRPLAPTVTDRRGRLLHHPTLQLTVQDCPSSFKIARISHLCFVRSTSYNSNPALHGTMQRRGGEPEYTGHRIPQRSASLRVLALTLYRRQGNQAATREPARSLSRLCSSHATTEDDTGW